MQIKFSGNELLQDPRYNKGTAFSPGERAEFALLGKLPPRVETIEEQCLRVARQIRQKQTPLEKNLLLNELYNSNRTLFFKVVDQHLEELLPIIYTPTIGDAVIQYSSNFQRPQGLTIAYEDRDRLEEIFADIDADELDIAVVTDGEGVLGIGDQGVGGLNIAIGKLMVYTACAGINPHRTLPIQLDVGTNNLDLLNDELYLGQRHERISSEKYLDFLDRFVEVFKQKFKTTFLHWEDFGKDNARKVLDRYRLAHPSFNDDIQGTGAISLAAVLTGIKKSGLPSQRHKFCIFGAGTAGTGIADQICQALAKLEGTDISEIRKRFYLIDRYGLIREGQERTLDFQRPYLKSAGDLQGWQCSRANECSLLDVVRNAGISVLIGCSTATGAFDEAVLKQMAENSPHPIIMPLSNPTSKAEATPADIISCSQGRAYIASGSPFAPVEFAGLQQRISQCNNALIYPGIGLGMLISGAKVLSDDMLLAASEALAGNCNSDPQSSELLPRLAGVKQLSAQVARAVARQAMAENLCPDFSPAELEERLNKTVWHPKYPIFHK